MSSPQIQDHMKRFPYVTNPEQGIAEAMDYMRELAIRHLPVVSEDKLVGIVSDRDLRAALNLDKAGDLSVADVMKRDVYIADRHTPLSDVAADMAEGRIGSAIIVDVRGRVEGIFTTTDALKLLSDRLEDESLEDFIIDDDNYVDGAPMYGG